MPKPTTKSRQELRSRFVRNAIPTEADFADLIAASLNLADDGLLKLPDQPFSLVRQKPDQPVLRLYADAAGETAAWQLQLIGTEKPGVGLASQDGKLAWVVDGATGNVGISTATPAQRLVVQGAWNNGKDSDSSLTNGGTLAIKSDAPQLDFIDSSSNTNDWAIHVNDGKMAFIRSPWEYSDLMLDGRGNVGIGTDSPGHKLTVHGTFSTVAQAAGSGSDLTYRGIFGIRSNTPQLDFIDTDTNQKDWAIHVNDSKMFFIRSPWDDANLVLDGAGNVGIGTQSPAHKLVIEGGTGWKTEKDSQNTITYGGALAIKSTAPQIDFVDTTNSTDWAIHVAGKKMYFIRSPWETDFMLDGAGSVGIGTTTPSHRLTVEGTWPDRQATGSDLSKAGILSIRSNQPQLDFIDTDANAKDWAIHVNGSKMYFIRSPWESSDLVLDGTGNVGIGTDNPTARLHVSGTTRLDSDVNMASGKEIFFADNGQIRSCDGTHRLIFRRSEDKLELREYGDIIFSSGSDGSETAKMIVQRSGNVGIGTAAPAQRLVVQGAWNNGKDSDSSLTNGGTLAIKSDAPQLDFIDSSSNTNDWSIHVNNGKMWFIRSPWEYSDLMFDGTGNVGIGTDSPGHKLTVHGTFSSVAQAAGSGSDLTYRGIFGIRSNTPQLDFIDTDTNQKDWAIHVNQGKMFFIRSPWDDANLVLDDAGNVGIGTQTPAQKLVIEGGAGWNSQKDSLNSLTYGGALAIKSTAPQIDFVDTNGSTDWAIHVDDKKMYFIRSPWESSDLVLDGTGNVGIGSESPSHKLTVQGTWPDRQATGSDLSKAGILSIRSNQPQLDFIDTDANAKDWAIHVNGSKMYFIRSPWECSDLVLDGTGNVGIGTDVPTAKLHVTGNIRCTGIVSSNCARSIVRKWNMISTSSTTWITMEGMQTSITLQERATVLFLFKVGGVQKTSDGFHRLNFRMFVDTTQTDLCYHEFHNSGWDYRDVVLMSLDTLDRGEHTVRIEWCLGKAGCTAYASGDESVRTLMAIEL